MCLPGQRFTRSTARCATAAERAQDRRRPGNVSGAAGTLQRHGVTDDESGSRIGKVENGIRLSGMPAFKGQLTEKQIWQVAVLVKNADKIPES